MNKEEKTENIENIYDHNYFCNKVCRTLHSAGVPNNLKWRAAINFLRTIKDNKKYTYEQKKSLQKILYRFLAKKDYSEDSFNNLMTEIDAVTNNPYVYYLMYLKDIEHNYKKMQILLNNILQKCSASFENNIALIEENIQTIDKIHEKTIKNKEIVNNIQNNVEIKKKLQEIINEFIENTNILLIKMENGLNDLVSMQKTSSQWQQIASDMEKMAFIDSLTGVKNRRAFNLYIEEITERIFLYVTILILDLTIGNKKLLENCIEYHLKYNGIKNVIEPDEKDLWIENINYKIETDGKISFDLSSLSLSMIDIDNFKKINDTFGHLTGDEVLKYVSNFTKNYIKEYETNYREQKENEQKENGQKENENKFLFSADIYRYGGEEFIVLVENIPDKKNIVEMLENIRMKISNYQFILRYGYNPMNIHANSYKVTFFKQHDNRSAAGINISVSIGVFNLTVFNIVNILKNSNYFDILSKYIYNNQIKLLELYEGKQWRKEIFSNIVKLDDIDSIENEKIKEILNEIMRECQFSMQSFIYNIVDIADMCMYRSKKAGKNCVHVI